MHYIESASYVKRAAQPVLAFIGYMCNGNEETIKYLVDCLRIMANVRIFGNPTAIQTQFFNNPRAVGSSDRT